MSETVQAALLRFLAAYDDLVALGEEVEDEWSYVNDLANAWRSRLEALGSERAEEAFSAAASSAVDTLIAELGLIEDPHRAIDWLSTAPQVALLALGEEP